MEVKALVVGLLEDNGRVLFLLARDAQGAESITLPSVLIESGDPVSQLAEAFKQQTGIDGEVKETFFEGKWNAGSRKRKKNVPLLAYNVSAKSAKCTPSRQFAGFKWLPLKDALSKKLDRRSEWLKRLSRPG